MIKQSDIDFVRKRASSIPTIVAQDDAFRSAVFIECLEQGQSKEEAAGVVRKRFPMFYYRIEDRTGEGVDSPDDAYLPFALKARLGPLKLISLRKRAKSYSSFNACIRDMIRSGKL